LFYAPLQGIRNFCDYTLADRALRSTVGLGSWLIVVDAFAAAAGAGAAAGAPTFVRVGLIPTIIYFLLD
jgi:hypothetical protein